VPNDTVIFEDISDTAVFIKPAANRACFYACKRTLDIAVTLLLIPSLLFVCLIALVLNPFLNPGKLFYSQNRVGKDKTIFKIYKLRTMLGGTENTRFATDETGRITSLGKFMRYIHVDELPQILNVLIGDMSLIGPRPEQIEFFNEYAANIQGFDLRQSVRPGISGLAQLHYGYTDCLVGARLKLKWDIDYINRLGLAQEVDIFLKTARYVFQRIIKAFIQLEKTAESS
jgi:lipopolysaccharide/colanic/teichoic acid biosynthesis glycosyltransferase